MKKCKECMYWETEDWVYPCNFCNYESSNFKPAQKNDPIVEAVRTKLLSRSQVGLTKYGVGLNRPDLSKLEWLIHAQEEAMDLANYLEVLIQKEQQNG